MAEDDAPWSPLGFAEEAAVFKAATQNARVLSEGWVAANGFCPSCGAAPLTAFAANSPVADFHCGVCAEEYELKSTKGRTDAKLVNGAQAALLFRHSGRRRACAADPERGGAREREAVADIAVGRECRGA